MAINIKKKRLALPNRFALLSEVNAKLIEDRSFTGLYVELNEKHDVPNRISMVVSILESYRFEQLTIQLTGTSKNGSHDHHHEFIVGIFSSLKRENIPRNFRLIGQDRKDDVNAFHILSALANHTCFKKLEFHSFVVSESVDLLVDVLKKNLRLRTLMFTPKHMTDVEAFTKILSTLTNLPHFTNLRIMERVPFPFIPVIFEQLPKMTGLAKLNLKPSSHIDYLPILVEYLENNNTLQTLLLRGLAFSYKKLGPLTRVLSSHISITKYCCEFDEMTNRHGINHIVDIIRATNNIRHIEISDFWWYSKLNQDELGILYSALKVNNTITKLKWVNKTKEDKSIIKAVAKRNQTLFQKLSQRLDLQNLDLDELPETNTKRQRT